MKVYRGKASSPTKTYGVSLSSSGSWQEEGKPITCWSLASSKRQSSNICSSDEVPFAPNFPIYKGHQDYGVKVLIVEVVRASIHRFSDGHMLTIDWPKAMMLLPSAAVGVGDDHLIVRSSRSYSWQASTMAELISAITTQIELYATLKPYFKLLELSPVAM